MISQYFKTRKAWAIETEERIAKKAETLNEEWSRIIEQREMMVENKIKKEKDLEIKALKREIEEKDKALKTYRESDLKITQLRNELVARIEHLDYQTTQFGEIHNRMSQHLGVVDYLLDNSRKLANKEIG